MAFMNEKAFAHGVGCKFLCTSVRGEDFCVVDFGSEGNANMYLGNPSASMDLAERVAGNRWDIPRHHVLTASGEPMTTSRSDNYRLTRDQRAKRPVQFSYLSF